MGNVFYNTFFEKISIKSISNEKMRFKKTESSIEQLMFEFLEKFQ